MTTITFFGLFFFLAWLIEALVEEYIGKPLEKSTRYKKYSKFLVILTAIFGLAAAITYRIDLLWFLAISLGEKNWPITWLGIIFTGLIIGAGSGFVHRVMKFFEKPGATTEPADTGG